MASAVPLDGSPAASRLPSLVAGHGLRAGGGAAAAIVSSSGSGGSSAADISHRRLRRLTGGETTDEDRARVLVEGRLLEQRCRDELASLAAPVAASPHFAIAAAPLMASAAAPLAAAGSGGGKARRPAAASSALRSAGLSPTFDWVRWRRDPGGHGRRCPCGRVVVRATGDTDFNCIAQLFLRDDAVRDSAAAAAEPSPPPTAPPLSLVRLLEERHAGTPWRLVTTCMLLNRTTARAAEPVLEDLLRRYPTPVDLACADAEELTGMIAPLGLQSTRARSLIAMAQGVVLRSDGMAAASGGSAACTPPRPWADEAVRLLRLRQLRDDLSDIDEPLHAHGGSGSVKAVVPLPRSPPALRATDAFFSVKRSQRPQRRLAVWQSSWEAPSTPGVAAASSPDGDRAPAAIVTVHPPAAGCADGSSLWPWVCPCQLRGVGTYAVDAFYLMCTPYWGAIQPADHALAWYRRCRHDAAAADEDMGLG